MLHYARGKLEAKRLDLIAANRVGLPGCGFDSADNELTLLWPDGELALPRASKAELARRLLLHVSERIRSRQG